MEYKKKKKKKKKLILLGAIRDCNVTNILSFEGGDPNQVVGIKVGESL